MNDPAKSLSRPDPGCIEGQQRRRTPRVRRRRRDEARRTRLAHRVQLRTTSDGAPVSRLIQTESDDPRDDGALPRPG